MSKRNLKKCCPIELLLILFMTFALMPDVVSVAGHSLKPMYFLFVVLLFLVVKKNRVIKPNNVILCLFAFMFFVSILASFRWGIDRLLINYCFGLVVVTIFQSLGNSINDRQWQTLLRKVWLLLLVAVLINNARQAYRFVEYIQYHLEHPFIETLVNGGCNIEATWIAILAMSYFNSKKRWMVLGISVVISMIYASRVGIIADVIVTFIFAFGKMSKDTRKKVFNRSLWFISATVMGVIILFVIDSGRELSSLKVLSRFTEIGHDPGSLGRLAMWRYVPRIIISYPFGVGLGNSIKALETVSPLIYEDGNLHNLFMQMGCEIGVLGGMFYILIWAFFLIKERTQFLSCPIKAMLLIYFSLCMFQFRGGETIFFCLLGIYFCSCNKSQQPRCKQCGINLSALQSSGVLSQKHSKYMLMEKMSEEKKARTRQ